MTYTQKVTIENSVLYQGDCIEVMRGMADNSVDSIVCDPPYLLGFMGKAWDAADGIAGKSDVWREALRVLKPGGHLLAFGAPRTNHRMVTAIEDAGFEIRDSVMWLFGSGFPKSLNIGKAIDKAAGAVREVIGMAVRVDGRVPEMEPGNAPCAGYSGGLGAERKITAPATPAAKKWQGFGTALKPAYEPVCVARKPLIGTVAANVLHWGTGGLNIDGCRVGEFVNTTPSGVDRRNAALAEAGYRPGTYQMGETKPDGATGRWPANIILDGSPEVLAGFPKDGSSTKPSRTGTAFKATGLFPIASDPVRYSDTGGSAARFFYTAKASKSDRNEGCDHITEKQLFGDAGGTYQGLSNSKNPSNNSHPTVKPTDLMAYLCRLVTPPGGTVLDIFMGSGSTGKAAAIEGFAFVGIEREAEYFEISQARIKQAHAQGQLFSAVQTKPEQLALAPLEVAPK